MVAAARPYPDKFEKEVRKADDVEELKCGSVNDLTGSTVSALTITIHCKGLFSFRTMAAAAISTKIVTGTATMVK